MSESQLREKAQVNWQGKILTAGHLHSFHPSIAFLKHPSRCRRSETGHLTQEQHFIAIHRLGYEAQELHRFLVLDS